MVVDSFNYFFFLFFAVHFRSFLPKLFDWISSGLCVPLNVYAFFPFHQWLKESIKTCTFRQEYLRCFCFLFFTFSIFSSRLILCVTSKSLARNIKSAYVTAIFLLILFSFLEPSIVQFMNIAFYKRRNEVNQITISISYRTFGMVWFHF